MFAGRDFDKDEHLQEWGDVVVPIVDLRYHLGGQEQFVFLWDEYTWSAETLAVDHEGYADVFAASPGFGAAANSFLPLHNVDEWYATVDTCGLHRSKDPGVGAFSAYHNRTSTAIRPIHAGEELFVSYGDEWFEVMA
jgi:hypothetical protein